MASGLYRRKIPFRYAGLFFPDEAAFLPKVQEFVRAVAVVKGLKGARLGQVGVRPPTFETVGYDEVAMIRQFGQNVIYANLMDITDRAKSYADKDPQVLEIVNDIKACVGQVTVVAIICSMPPSSNWP
jgi:L-fucose isomerase-like protein